MNGPVSSAPTVGAALRLALSELPHAESGSLEAQVLLARLLDRPRGWILAHPEANLPENILSRYLSLLRRAGEGEPLAYLTGSQEFFGLSFEVAPDVLIPRPETERLVETALAWVSARRERIAPPAPPFRVVDLGTGCGCIAAALAARVPVLYVIATDISFRALALAARNFAALDISNRVRLLQADLLAPLGGPIDLLCANLPYVPAAMLEGLPVARYEPRIALDGGPDGLRLISRALEQSVQHLAEDGLALFEIEELQGRSARNLACKYFPQAKIVIEKDLIGKDRLLQIQT